MVIDDILLMAYVDGELPLRERQEVEKAIDASADLAERAALLKASKLPYQVAYAHQKLPPFLKGLLIRSPRWRALIRCLLTWPHDCHRQGCRTSPRGQCPTGRACPLAGTRRGPWLAVAFVAGILCYRVVLRVAPGLNRFAAPLAARDRASHWVVAAASYQQLYSRDTIALDWLNPEVSAQTLRDIRLQDGLELCVPDLRAAGLTFKRVQRLRFNNKTLV
jgi:anti-sigma factor RsiW